MPYSGIVYGEQKPTYYSVKGAGSDLVLKLSAEHMPEGASFDAEKGRFFWQPEPSQTGEHTVVFVVDDGIIPEKTSVLFIIE